MKMLFKEGYVNKENKINFKPTYADAEALFDESVVRFTRKMNIYNFDLYRDNIYYIYDISYDKDDIIRELNSLYNGNMDNVVNNESTIKNALRRGKTNSSIFWDVFNNLIIVVGKENLQNLIYEIEISRWRKILKYFNSSIDEIKYDNLSPITQKVKKI